MQEEGGSMSGAIKKNLEAFFAGEEDTRLAFLFGALARGESGRSLGNKKEP